MSATARTEGQRNPDGLDFYETPAWSVRRILEAVHLPPGNWLDPCAGTGAIPIAVGWREHWTTVEIDTARYNQLFAAGFEQAIFGDFFNCNLFSTYDVAIFNPPFPLAEQFVRACIPTAKHVLCLQRINWAAKRGSLLTEHKADVWMLPDRPAFGLNKLGKVGTDATEYAWFHWHKDAIGLFRVLPRSSKDELKAANDRIRENCVVKKLPRKGFGTRRIV